MRKQREKLTMRLNVGGMRARRWLYLAADKGRTVLSNAEGGVFGMKRTEGLLLVPSTFSVEGRNGL
jgi:hypothetical protein